MRNQEIAKWDADYEYLALPATEKANVVGNYFDKNMADDEFRTLPQEEQQKIRSNFLSANVEGYQPPAASQEKSGEQSADGETSVGDYSRSLAIGLDRFGQTLGRTMQWGGLENSGKWVEGKYKKREEQLRSELSPAFKAEQAKPFLSEKEGSFWGEGSTSFAKIAGTILESAPSMAVGMGTGAALTQGFVRLGMSAGLAGVLGGGLGEGSVAAVETAKDFEDIILEAPGEKLAQSDEFQEIYNSLPGDIPETERFAAARRELATKTAAWGAAKVGGMTALLGAPSGHALGKIIGGESGRTLLGTMGKQGLLEALQEAPQSAYETFAANQVVQRNVDFGHSLSTGVGESAMGGAITGGVMGVGLGGGAHRIGHAVTPDHQGVQALNARSVPVQDAVQAIGGVAGKGARVSPSDYPQDAGYTEDEINRRYSEEHAPVQAPFPNAGQAFAMGAPTVTPGQVAQPAEPEASRYHDAPGYSAKEVSDFFDQGMRQALEAGSPFPGAGDVFSMEQPTVTPQTYPAQGGLPQGQGNQLPPGGPVIIPQTTERTGYGPIPQQPANYAPAMGMPQGQAPVGLPEGQRPIAMGVAESAPIAARSSQDFDMVSNDGQNYRPDFDMVQGRPPAVRENTSPATAEQIAAEANEAATAPENATTQSPPADSKSHLGQSSGNSRPADTEFSGNGSNAHTTIKEGFNSLERDRQHVVLSQVASSLGDKKVLNAVVESVPVDVMDNLIGTKGAAQMVLHDPSMLAHRLTVPSDKPIPQPIVSFIDSLSPQVVGGSAPFSAEKESLPDPSGSSESGTTLGTDPQRALDTLPTTEMSSRSGVGFGGATSESPSTGVASESDKGHTKFSFDGETHEVNTDPTEAQKQAGVYKKGHVRVLGMDVSIENPAGSERSGTDSDGKPWSIEMEHHYGYIKGTVGKDKDHLDVFMKNGTGVDEIENRPVYVVDQINEDGSFDEHKILAGFENEQDARQGYLANYEDGWQGLGAITEMAPDQFKEWVHNGNTKKPLALGQDGGKPQAREKESADDHEAVFNRDPEVALNDLSDEEADNSEQADLEEEISNFVEKAKSGASEAMAMAGNDFGKGKVHFTRTDGRSKGMNRKAVEMAVRKLQKTSRGSLPLKVVKSFEDLPQHVQDEAKKSDSGYIEAANDGESVYMVADNVASRRRAVALWMHEQGVHSGFKGLFGTDHRRILNHVFVAAGGKKAFKELAERYGFDLNSRIDQMNAAEEYLANLAEKVSEGHALEGREVPVWRRVVNAVTRWLRNLGLNLKLTDSEVAWIVNESIRTAVQGNRVEQSESGMAPAVAFAKSDDAKTGEEYGQRVLSAEKKWSDIVDRAVSGKLHPRAILQMGQTPDLLVELGAPDLPLTMRKTTFDKVTGAAPDKHSGRTHGLTVEQLKGLYRELADPVAVIGQRGNKFKVVVDMLEDGKPVAAIMDLAANEGRLEINSIATAFGDERNFRAITGAARGGDLEYMDPKKLDALEDMSDNRQPGEPVSVRVLRARRGKKIKFPTDVVKPAFSRTRFSKRGTSGPSTSNVSAKDILSQIAAEQGGRNLPHGAQDVARALVNRPSQIAEAAASGKSGLIDRINSKDLSVLQEVASLPHWIAKRFPAFDAIYRRQLSRMDERASVLKESLEEVEDFFTDMTPAEHAELRDIIWKIDGEKLPGLDGDKFIQAELDDGRPLFENGRPVLEMNPAYYDAFEKWTAGQGLPPKAQRALVALRESLDRDFLRAYDAMRQMAEIDDDTIKEFRTNINHVHNYFPHKRYGAYYIQAVGDNHIGQNAEGKWVVYNAAGVEVSDAFKEESIARKHLAENKLGVVYREHFDSPSKKMAKRKAEGKLPALKAEYGADLEWSTGLNERLPDDVYEFGIDTNAMEQIIKAAADSLEDKAQANEIRASLSSAVADTMKARGWSGATIARKGIPGHELDDIQGIVYDYKAGLSGWLTKMAASRDFTSLLGDINAKRHPREYTYATKYVQNMLRNADKIDRAVGNVKAMAFLWYLGFNLKTAALNLTQNVIAGVPRLGMDVRGGGTKYVKAAMDKLTDSVTGHNSLAEDESRLMDELYREDVITEGFLNEIRGKVQGVSLASISNKVLRAAGWPMAMAERFNRGSLALAAYRAARDGHITNKSVLKEYGKRRGETFDYDQAKAYAENVVRDAHFVYGKTNLPQPLRNSTLGRGMNPAYTFRTFSHNILSLWNWMLTTQGAEGRKAFAKSMAGTMAIGGFTALPFYATLMHLFQWITGDDDDWTEEIRKQLPEGDMLRDMASYGLPAGAGFSLGGSVGLETPVLSRVEPGATLEETISDNLGDILGIPYDMFIRKPTMVMKALKSGNEWRAFEEAAPTIIKNGMAGYRLWKRGQYSMSGKPINEPGQRGPRKLTKAEALGKMAGFQPTSSRKSYDKYRAREVSKAARSEKAGELANRIVRAYRDGDSETVQDTLKELREWNRQAKADKKLWMVITRKDLTSRIKSRLKTGGLSPRDALRLRAQMEAY